MSRSRKKPFITMCQVRSSETSKGKRLTSRLFRREVRRLLKMYERDELVLDEFVQGSIHLRTGPLDRNRGNHGSRDSDYGWKYFGDGRFAHPQSRVQYYWATWQLHHGKTEWQDKHNYYKPWQVTSK